MGQRVRTTGENMKTLTGVCDDVAGHVQYDIILLEGTVCVVYFEATVALGATFYPIYSCEKIVMTKRAGAAGFAFTAGQKVYWSGINGDPVYPFHRSGFYWIGIATEAATTLATTVEIDFKGDKASVTEPL